MLSATSEWGPIRAGRSHPDAPGHARISGEPCGSFSAIGSVKCEVEIYEPLRVEFGDSAVPTALCRFDSNREFKCIASFARPIQLFCERQHTVNCREHGRQYGFMAFR